MSTWLSSRRSPDLALVYAGHEPSQEPHPGHLAGVVAHEVGEGRHPEVCDDEQILAGGARAVEHLRLVMAEVQVATVRNQVMLSLHDDFENYSVFKPREFHEKSVGQVIDQVIAWGGALRAVREKRA